MDEMRKSETTQERVEQNTKVGDKVGRNGTEQERTRPNEKEHNKMKITRHNDKEPDKTRSSETAQYKNENKHDKT